MFDFLKKKIKQTIDKVTGRTEKKIEKKPEPKKEKIKEKKEILKPEPVPEKKVESVKKIKEEKKIEKVEPVKEKPEPQKIEKKKEPKKEGFSPFARITKAFTERVMNKKDFDKLFWDLELGLLENNVSSEVVDRIRLFLEEELVGASVKRDFNKVLNNALSKVMNEVLVEESEKELLTKIKNIKPLIIMFVGVNGSGKTTSLAKLAKYFKDKKISSVMGACDTFRAASIEQLRIHADRVGVPVVSNKYGSDAASVAYDTVRYAQSKKIDVVLLDTAGRLQTDANLMQELEKIKRVAKPDLVIFVADSLTGNDATTQAKIFNEKIGIDYSILTKADVDQKGGAILSVGYATKKPILFIGTGQEYKHLTPFKKKEIIKKLLD